MDADRLSQSKPRFVWSNAKRAPEGPYGFDCSECRKPIEDLDGLIYIATAWVDEAEMDVDALEPRPPEGHQPGQEFSFVDPRAGWATVHSRCVAHPAEERLFEIPLAEFRDPADALRWTAELMRYDWLFLTDWRSFIAGLPRPLEGAG